MSGRAAVARARRRRPFAARCAGALARRSRRVGAGPGADLRATCETVPSWCRCRWRYQPLRWGRVARIDLRACALQPKLRQARHARHARHRHQLRRGRLAIVGQAEKAPFTRRVLARRPVVRGGGSPQRGGACGAPRRREGRRAKRPQVARQSRERAGQAHPGHCLARWQPRLRKGADRLARRRRRRLCGAHGRWRRRRVAHHAPLASRFLGHDGLFVHHLLLIVADATRRLSRPDRPRRATWQLHLVSEDEAGLTGRAVQRWVPLDQLGWLMALERALERARPLQQ